MADDGGGAAAAAGADDGDGLGGEEEEEDGEQFREWMIGNDATFVLPARYQAKRWVGSGVFGIVCAAEVPDCRGPDPDKPLEVAVKRIRLPGPDTEDEEKAVRRIVREVLLLAHFEHENIVRLYDLFERRLSFTSGRPDVYIVTELCDTNLKTLLSEYPHGMPSAHVKYFSAELLAGLRHLHRVNVLHRDLKPENVVINVASSELKIVDFGLARDQSAEGDMTQGISVVTLWYRPPELLLNTHSYCPSVDIWSAGCVIAELLSGRELFKGRGAMNPVDGAREQLREVVRRVDPPAADVSALIDEAGITQGGAAQQMDEFITAAPRAGAPLRGALTADRAASARLHPPPPGLEDDAEDAASIADCADLVVRLVAFVPTQRPSAAEALRHRSLCDEDPAQEDASPAAPLGAELRAVDDAGVAEMIATLRRRVASFHRRLPPGGSPAEAAAADDGGGGP